MSYDLHNIHGIIDEQQHAKEWTWLGVGGKPLFTFYPEDTHDLAKFCKSLSKDIPYRTFGAASNTLIRDNGFAGVFIRLRKGFRSLEINETQIIAGAGLSSSFLVQAALEREIGGIAFMATIPGLMGGLAKMNAGAHQMEMRNIVEWIEFMDNTGQIHRLNNEECDFSYRRSCIKSEWIILRIALRGKKQSKEDIAKEITHLMAYRRKTQPISGKMAGCFFKNTDTTPAWSLIKECTIERYVESDNVEISPIHANFIINKGKATAFDLEYFATKLQAKIFFSKQIALEMEIERVGY